MKVFVKVKTKSKTAKVEQIDADHFEVWVNKPPVDGEANQSVIELLAKHLKIPKSNFVIVRGTKSRIKVLEIRK